MKFNLINEKLYYVALGDSITESLNVDFQYGIAGYYEKAVEKVHGISYPSYLTLMYQKLGIVIENYQNFALSGSKTTDWLYFLGEKNYSYKNSQEYIENYTSKVKTLIEGTGNRVKKSFKNFGKEDKSDFDFLKKEIAKANFITMTIGANDIIKYIKSSSIMDIFLGTTETKMSLENLSSIISELKNNIKKIVTRIKSLNKNNAEIYLLGYLKPLNRINPIISKMPNGKILNELWETLNNTIKEVSKELKVNYINFFNDEEWRKEAKKFTKYSYDIHPTIIGYKKIAQQIFIKTTMNNAYFSEAKNNEKIQELFPDINKEYFLKDHKCFESFFNFGTNEKQVEKIVNIAKGKEKDFLSEKDSNWTEYLKYFNAKPNIFLYLSTNINLLGKERIETTIRIIVEFFKTRLKQDIHLVDKFLKKEANFKVISEIIWSSEYINYFFEELQKKVDEKDPNLNNINDFNEILIIILSDDKLLFLFFKNILILLEKNKKIIDISELKKTFSLLFKKIISNEERKEEFIKIINIKINEFNNYNSIVFPEKIIEILINNMFSPNLIDNTIESMINSFTSLTKQSREINDFESFFKYFLNILLSDFRSNDYIFKVIDNNKKEIIKLFSKYLISFFNIENTNENDLMIIENFIEKIVNKIIKTNKLDLILINIFSFFKFKKIYESNLADFIFILSPTELNKIVLSLTSLKLNDEEEKSLCLFLDLLFSKSNKSKGLIYIFIKNLKPPSAFIKNKDKSISLLSMSRAMFNKFNSLTGLIKFIFNIVYNQKIKLNKKNTVENEFYDSLIYRITTLIAFSSYSVFQKNNKINIFWYGNDVKLNVFPSIISVIHFTLTEGGTNPIKTEIIHKIFNDPIKKIKNMSLINENNYSPDNFLYILSTSEKYPNYKFKKNKTKTEIIIDSIIEGKPINRV
ncbi:MAG: SGNH/GDSL hydrolase family protein [Metamycoplasmataceae bacterium]